MSSVDQTPSYEPPNQELLAKIESPGCRSIEFPDGQIDVWRKLYVSILERRNDRECSINDRGFYEPVDNALSESPDGQRNDQEAFESLHRLFSRVDVTHIEGETAQGCARHIADQLGYSTSIEQRGDQTFVCCEVPQEDLAEYLGVATWVRGVGIAVTSSELPTRAKRFVMEHEIRHLLDRKFLRSYDGPMRWFLAECRASLHAFRNPIDCLSVLMHNLKKKGSLRRALTLAFQVLSSRPAALPPHGRIFERLNRVMYGLE